MQTGAQVGGQVGRNVAAGGVGARSLTWAGRGGLAGGAMGGGIGALGAMGDEDRTMAQGAFGGIARGAMIGAGAGAIGGAGWQAMAGNKNLTMHNIKRQRKMMSNAYRQGARNVPTNNLKAAAAHFGAKNPTDFAMVRGDFNALPL